VRDRGQSARGAGQNIKISYYQRLQPRNRDLAGEFWMYLTGIMQRTWWTQILRLARPRAGRMTHIAAEAWIRSLLKKLNGAQKKTEKKLANRE